jgi:hypothetical protein
MKISYRNNLGIRIVETGFFMLETITPKDEEFLEELRENFGKYKYLFKPIKIISKNMAEVIASSANKMIQDEVWNDVGKCNGTIICNGFTYCYMIESKGQPEHDFGFFAFYAGVLIACGHQNTEEKRRTIAVPESSKWVLEFVHQPEGEDWHHSVFNALYTDLIAIINFLKYAEVEDKFIKASSKEKGIDCKYINETNSDVHYITSNYIQNLYIQGAFKVRGHWRLQPKKKEGEWTKELIWINEFEKQGYTRKAEILKHAD